MQSKMVTDALGRSVPSTITLGWASLLLPVLFQIICTATVGASPVDDAKSGIHDPGNNESDTRLSNLALSESPSCTVEMVQLNCSFIIADEIRDDFADELDDIMFASSDVGLPRNLDMDGVSMSRQGSMTQTNVSLGYYGDWIEFKRLRGIFLKVRIWQGENITQMKHFIIAVFSEGNEFPEFKERYTQINIKNINIPVSNHDLMGEVTASKLPVKKGKKSDGDTYDILEHNAVSMSYIIPSVIPMAENDLQRQVQTSRNDKCDYQNISANAAVHSTSITVDFCEGVPKDVKVKEVLVQHISTGKVEKQSVELNNCQEEIKELFPGKYTIKLQIACLGETFITIVGNVSLSAENVSYHQWIPTDLVLYISLSATGVVGICLLGLLLLILVKRSNTVDPKEQPWRINGDSPGVNDSQGSFGRFISNKLRLLWRRKRVTRKKRKDPDNKIEGVMIIALENCSLTEHLSKHLSDRGILTRNILNREEGMKNWMDWVENSVSHSNHYVFIVTSELYRNFKKRKYDSPKSSSANTSTKPCNYALTLVRQSFVEETYGKGKQIHVISTDSQLIRKLKVLYPIFRNRRCHSYIIPFHYEEITFSEIPSIRKMTKRLQNDKTSQKSSCYFEAEINVNTGKEDSQNENDILLRKPTADEFGDMKSDRRDSFSSEIQYPVDSTQCIQFETGF